MEEKDIFDFVVPQPWRRSCSRRPSEAGLSTFLLPLTREVHSQKQTRESPPS